MRDPGNLGTMLRTGDAVGAGGLILIDECADPFSAEAVRASMGAVFTQAIAQAPWSEFVGWLRQGEGQLVAASLRDGVPYRGAPYRAPCFILVGNEIARVARRLRGRVRLARDDADARPRRQPQRRDRRRGAGLRGAGVVRGLTAFRPPQSPETSATMLHLPFRWLAIRR